MQINNSKFDILETDYLASCLFKNTEKCKCSFSPFSRNTCSRLHMYFGTIMREERPNLIRRFKWFYTPVGTQTCLVLRAWKVGFFPSNDVRWSPSPAIIILHRKNCTEVPTGLPNVIGYVGTLKEHVNRKLRGKKTSYYVKQPISLLIIFIEFFNKIIIYIFSTRFWRLINFIITFMDLN